LIVVPVAVSLLVSASTGRPVLAAHLSSGCSAGRRVALTFDDGPNPPYTGQILDVLVNAGVRATFFVEGAAVEANPDIVNSELALGMAVGSHSYGHSKSLPSMSTRDFADDLARADTAIRSVTGFPPALYRPPYGNRSTTMLKVLRSRGYTSIGWDVDSADWSDAGVDAIVANVLDRAHPGAIVLMHDGGLGGGNSDRTATLAALPRIIDGLRGRGYELVTVPEITGIAESRDAAGWRGAVCSAN